MYDRQVRPSLLSKQMAERMARDKSNLAIQFYRLLVKQATTDIKKGFEELNKSHADDFFIEINLQRRRKGRSLEHK